MPDAKPGLAETPGTTVSETTLPLESILCTQELNQRPARAPDYATENRALLALAQALVDSPRTILQTLSDTVLALLNADSAGLSLLTPDEMRFHWPSVSGMWSPHTGGGTPREFSPCGDVLDADTPLLFRRAERRYAYFIEALPLAEECLLVPFYVAGRAVGTIWAIAHDARRQFDSEDLRLLESLGKFASAAYQATESLNNEKEFNRSIIESSLDCFQVLDLEGRLLSMHNGQALLGIEDNRAFLHQSWVALWEGGDRQAASAAVEAAAAGREGRFVGLFRTLGGEPKWWDVAISPILDTHGQPARLLAISRDMTERIQAQQALNEAADALAALDRRKDEFLAMLSHELRNPLAPISNALKILQLQKNEDPLQQQARTLIERQVGNLKHLIDDLLEVSRISTGRVQLRRERIAVSSVVDRAVETARPLLVQRRHELTLCVPAQPLWLQADAARLEQVVVNLLTNAAKYTDEGGRIGLSVEQEGDEAVLRVHDTGIGIAAELLPHIFDLFTQAQRSLDRSQGGLGIGLCLVRRLVELHGGTVEAHSVPGQGSEFVVRLPALRDFMPLPSPSPSPSMLPSAQTAPLPGHGCRVLVVDDNVDLAHSLVMLLEISGHAARMVHDGPSALETALIDPPDVVLLDIGLPGLDGFEVARRMRQQPALKGVMLIALTGYGRATDRQQSKEAGIDYHLVKPADFDEVRKILTSVAHRKAGSH